MFSRPLLQLSVALTVAASPAAAQTAAEVQTFDMERLSLNPSGLGSLLVGSGELMPAGSFRSMSFAHYAHRPLLLEKDGAAAGVAVRERLTLHLMRQYSLMQRVELSLQLPIILYQSGEDLRTFGEPQLAAGGLGSPVVSARLALLRSVDGAPLDLALQAASGLPFGNPNAYGRERGFTLSPKLLASRKLPGMVLSAEAGGLLRPPASFGDVLLRNELHAALGLATTGPTLKGDGGVRGAWALEGNARPSYEVYAGPRYPLSETVELAAIGSVGIGQAPGTPAFRVLIGVSLTEGVQVSTPPVTPTAPTAPPREEPPAPVRSFTSEEPKPEPKPAEPVRVEAPEAAEPARPTRGRLAGVVRDAKSGAPVGGVLVAISGSELPPVASDPETGRFLTHEVALGTVALSLQHPGHAPLTREVKVEAAQAEPLEFQLEPVTRPALLVFSAKASGKPVAATVLVTGQDAVTREVPLAPGAATPAKLELPAGQYTLSVGAQGFLSQLREVQVSEGGELALDFKLAPAPKKALVEVKEDQIAIKQQVHFATNKAILMPDSFALLDQVVDAIIKSNIKRLRIEGHTDNQGKPEANKVLSEARARAVADYFQRSGISPERIDVQGLGGDKPIAPNAVKAGRELNRRVEFHIVER